MRALIDRNGMCFFMNKNIFNFENLSIFNRENRKSSRLTCNVQEVERLIGCNNVGLRTHFKGIDNVFIIQI